jgi:hypothetical protein
VAQTKTKTRAPILEGNQPAPLAELEPEARARRIMELMTRKDPPKEVRDELRSMLEKAPDLALVYGNLPVSARNMGLGRFASLPIMEESIKARLKQIGKELLGADPTPLEKLLVDAVMLCYQDYFCFALIYGQQTDGSFTLDGMEKWERILASKEARYLRAITELARVRRLLNLPAPQVNINLPGGQQVNVSGKVET